MKINRYSLESFLLKKKKITKPYVDCQVAIARTAIDPLHRILCVLESWCEVMKNGVSEVKVGM